MGKRIGLWGVTIIAVLILAGGAYLSLAVSPDRITATNSDRIIRGMSAEQVEEILGRKPDEVTSYVVGLEFQTWVGRAGFIEVSFDNSGHVQRATFVQTEKQSLLDRLRSWLPW